MQTDHSDHVIEQDANGFLLASPDQVADALNVSRRTIDRWVHLGKFVRPMKLNGSTRFDLNEVIQWARANTVMLDAPEHQADSLPPTQDQDNGTERTA